MEMDEINGCLSSGDVKWELGECCDELFVWNSCVGQWCVSCPYRHKNVSVKLIGRPLIQMLNSICINSLLKTTTCCLCYCPNLMYYCPFYKRDYSVFFHCAVCLIFTIPHHGFYVLFEVGNWAKAWWFCLSLGCSHQKFGDLLPLQV